MATIVAESVSYAHVNAAIALASVGDTVMIPAGAATWSSQLVINKGIRLTGAGIEATVITNGYGGGTLSCLISYQPSAPQNDDAFRIDHLGFDCNNVGSWLVINNTASTPLTKIRLDNLSVVNCTALRWLRIAVGSGPVYGVAHSSILHGSAVFYSNNATIWTDKTFEFGSAENFYVEDCDLVWPTTASGLGGGAAGRYCCRHCTITYQDPTNGLYPAFDMHGNQGAGMNHAHMGAEVYENELTSTYNRGVGLFDHRGGMVLVFNNNVVTSGAVTAQARDEYADSLNPPAEGPDGETQHVCRSYYWNNLKNGSTLVVPSISGTVDYGGSIGLVPQWDRDCWKQVVPFTGATGMGVGTYASRPAATGLADGIGYWATDTQTLYRVVSEAWEVFFTPYTYPHPMRWAGLVKSSMKVRF